MKKLFPLILICFVFFLQLKAISFLHLFPREFSLSSVQKIDWEEDLEKARIQAKGQKKILFLYFTKKESSWCSRMEKEILQQEGFFQEMKEHFIFVRLSFERAEKEFLFFHVKKAPSVLLVDLQKEKIAEAGYLPLTGRKYAQEMKKNLREHFSSLNKERDSKKKNVGLFVTRGALEADSVRFHEGIVFPSLFEHYSYLLRNHSVDAPCVKECKKELEDLDPQNHLGIHLQLALEEFHELAKKNDPEKAAASLIRYIDLFGKKEKENLWILHMTISQFLFQEGKVEQALFHARASFRWAPLPVKKEVAGTVRYLKERLGNSESFPRDNL